MMMPRNTGSGFTLIELLVVIAMIAILAATLMPAVTSATDRARVNECRANLTHVAIAMKMYYNDQGAWPEDLQTLHEREYHHRSVAAGLHEDRRALPLRAA